MKISLIAAIDENRGLGKGNELLWRIPEDLKNFKKLTMGHYVLLGRKTYESIGRPLPGRTLLVLTRKKEEDSLSLHSSVIPVFSIQEALELASKNDEKELPKELDLQWNGKVWNNVQVSDWLSEYFKVKVDSLNIKELDNQAGSG